jgi:ribosome biogenesis GTPase / thiamine phosphate phosphatase
MQTPTRMTAVVIATFGRHLLLRDDSGVTRKARPVGRSLNIVCGDTVVFETRATSELLVTEILQRRTLLRRSNQRGQSEALVANLSVLAVVVAPLPQPDLFMLDRYLCAARCASLEAIVVVNKCDLEVSEELAAGLRVYRQLGYTVLNAAAQTGAGLPEFSVKLQHNIAALVGQSGVGKSSLIRKLALDVDAIQIGGLMREEEGRHTTTASRLYDCIAGGQIVDSPGVRDFAPAIDDLDRETLGFLEVDQFRAQCRFQDCRHMQEPHCAVRTAVDSGHMDQRRYESYRRLRRLFEQLWEQRPAGGRAAH